MLASFPSRRLASGLLIVGGVGALGTAALFVRLSADDPSVLVWSTPFLGAYAAGLVAFRLRPDHVATRRLLAFGTFATLFLGTAVGLATAFDAQGHQWWLGPGNTLVQVLGLAMGASMIALLAVYPDGAYTRPYQRRLVRVVTLLAVAVPVLLLVSRSTLEPSWVFAWGADAASFPQIDSPVFWGPLAFLGTPALVYLNAGLALAPLVGGVLVAVRYRRLRAEQRLQLRWPMYGVLVVLLAPLATVAHSAGALSLVIYDALVIVGLATLPAMAAIGLVRPQLFDVDRAARRSLVYAPLWIAIAGAYVGVAAALGWAASGAGVQLAVVVAVVATAMLGPARRWLVRRAGRWAYGERLGGEELLRRLGTTLEHTLDVEELSIAITALVREGMGSGWARLTTTDGFSATQGTAGTAEPPALRAELVHAGERLGVLECGPRVRGRVQPSDEELLQTLARQVSLAIHNARLAGQLNERLREIREQASELAASRTRIVAAQESARRGIERDIHDGSQQELVALIARIGLARNQHGKDSDRLAETLCELQAEARQALDNLRQLASGVHPAVLTDLGLVTAVESRVARLPVPVTIECDPGTRTMRFGDGVEGAAYFFVGEAVSNALKHAGAQQLRIRIAFADGQVTVDVADDGCGFEPGAHPLTSSGLRGLTDRLEALGGSLTVESSRGAGTRLTARIPVGRPAVV